ncbi:MAG: asparagine synthase (glutamine-hydrolyzing) [Nitrospiraceae bacterium]
MDRRMCGIAGIIQFEDRALDCGLLEAMTRSLAHRGPDGEGYVLLDPSDREKPLAVIGALSDSIGTEGDGLKPFRIGLGHRRLAIIDLTPLGHQPMATEDGRYWVTYNGELYNYVELRDELRAKGHRFRSNSDTEVLLAAYREWGEACLTRFNGMFAFALWDGVQHWLFCARDRLGEKPFYYRWDGERFAFASEIKGLLPACGRSTPNQRAVFAYLDGAALDDSNDTFFDGTLQLPPAHSLTVQNARVTLARYWDLPTAGTEVSQSPREAAESFRHLFSDAIRIQLRSDVPIGTCLSGGLDSSSIVCMAADLISKGKAEQLRTFSSCFEDPAYDERRFILPVLARTEAKPHYTFPDSKELAANVEQLVWQQDEPFGSTSIFAQWNVMRMAAQQGVKVLLDGQGADELLAGYHRFFGAFFADLLADGRGLTLLRELRAYWRLHGPISRYAVADLARALLPASLVSAIRGRMTGSANWLGAEFRRQGGFQMPERSAGPSSHVQRLQHALLTGKGLRALLHYEDRNSMAFGIETRLPYLDYRVVEYLYRLDIRHKIHLGWTKAVLREAMEGILPEEVRWRIDKMGFVTPEDQWLRTSLRELAHDTLADARTRMRGYLNVKAAQRALESHMAGRTNIGNTIWRWMNIELWCRRFVDRDPCVARVS